MNADACRTGRAWCGVLLAVCLTGPLPAQEYAGETLVFGGDAAYPPFEWLERGQPRGFHVDLEAAIAAIGGVEARHWLGDWPDAVRALESGAIDVLPMLRSAQREQSFLFTPPLHFLHHAIYARAGHANVPALEALAGSRIAVEELSFAHQSLTEEGFPATLELTANTRDALAAIVQGRAEYAVLAAPTAALLIREGRLPLDNVGPPLWQREYAFAVRRDRPELAAWLTAQLHTALRDGAYQSVYARWESELVPREESRWSLAAKYLAVPIALLALAGLLRARRLRAVLATRTRRLVEEVRRRRAAESQAQWASTHDAATRLPRLDHFAARADAILCRLAPASGESKQLVALRLADLDRMIRALGHETAVGAMREFAGSLRSMPFDVIGQSGRDVFLIFGDPRTIADQLRRRVSPSDTVILEGAAIPSVFAGAASWPADGVTLAELLRRAETALSVAVERREPWVDYRASMEPNAEDLRLLEQFRAAPGRGLYAELQPQIDIGSGAIVAAEALARWRVPDRGTVPPDRFVPLLEDAGLIRHLTSFMLREAVISAARFRVAGHDCPVSVNIAVSDMLGDRTRQAIFGILREHGGRAADLKLELTETGVADSPEAVYWVIARLRESGIRTSIDDFGTGYSSLSYLSEFPVDEVKIDRSFVSGMISRTQDRSIVRSTIAMAHELGLRVVAEGVETAEQLELLAEFGCDRAQGYLISRPTSAESLLDMLGAESNRTATMRLLARGA